MCWGERTTVTCPYCRGVTTHPTRWFGCPFGQELGSCNTAHVTGQDIMAAHARCEPIVPTALPAPPMPLSSAPASPTNTDYPTTWTPSPLPSNDPQDSAPLPASWSANGTQDTRSPATIMLTRQRDEMFTMLRDQTPYLSLYLRLIPDPQIIQVITWLERFMMWLADRATTNLNESIRFDEFRANHTTTPEQQALHDHVVNIMNGTVSDVNFSEPAFVWHRRFIDFYMHLADMVGVAAPRLTPPSRPEIPLRRRGAISGDNLTEAHRLLTDVTNMQPASSPTENDEGDADKSAQAENDDEAERDEGSGN